MGETRKLAAILVSDVVGYSRLAGTDEDRILARLRALRSDLIDPTIAVHHGRIVKRTGDGSIVEFRSVVDAVNCAIEIQRAMVERNAGLAPDKRIEFRIGIHLGDVVEESDGDLMGDGVNIAARLEGIAKPGAICLSEDAYRQPPSCRRSIPVSPCRHGRAFTGPTIRPSTPNTPGSSMASARRACPRGKRKRIEAPARAGAMLVACRLAGLSALEGQYDRVDERVQICRRGPQRAVSARTFPFRVCAGLQALATAWHPGCSAPVLPRTHNVVLRVGLS